MKSGPCVAAAGSGGRRVSNVDEGGLWVCHDDAGCSWEGGVAFFGESRMEQFDGAVPSGGGGEENAGVPACRSNRDEGTSPLGEVLLSDASCHT